VKSLEPLIATWWNWRTALPANTANNWPECLKGDGGKVGNNQSLVFVGDPVAAVESNVNARNQKCEISAGQLLYLTVMPVNVLQDQNLMRVNIRIQSPLLIF
jgi:hypothetical protein